MRDKGLYFCLGALDVHFNLSHRRLRPHARPTSRHLGNACPVRARPVCPPDPSRDRSTNQSNQLPSGNTAELHSDPALPLPKLHDRQTARVPPVSKRTDRKQGEGLTGSAQRPGVYIDEPPIPASRRTSPRNMLEGDVVLLSPIDAVDGEDEDGWGTFLGVAIECPVRAFELEGEADGASVARVEDFASWRDGSLSNTVVWSRVGEDGWWFDGAGPAGGVDEDVFFPFQSLAVREEEYVFVSGEMLDAEFFVGHGEVARFEAWDVWHACTLDMTSTPTGVDEFPFTTVDGNGIPSVARGVGGERGARFDGIVSVSFSVATNHNAFEASVCGEGGEESSVAFADC